jgi:hypothetical protein
VRVCDAGACAVGSIAAYEAWRDGSGGFAATAFFFTSFRPRQHTLVGGQVPQTSGRQYNIYYYWLLLRLRDQNNIKIYSAIKI